MPDEFAEEYLLDDPEAEEADLPEESEDEDEETEAPKVDEEENM